ncbi:hypothetical protein J5N97_017982 [Dioscorea zingiberensis]|uniref:Uncharacterized protein n=1 Tax=Dioscorea zingiberensis TaxID=325984 RepID=A0A9D5CPC5_9LILI|nr:hypothetical protein J5N97_017982 [Dioscorea zingiberensis]
MAPAQTLEKPSEPAIAEKEEKEEEKKKAADVIDEIFRSKKTKKKQSEPPSKDEKPEENPKPKKKAQSKKKRDKSKGISVVGDGVENRRKRRRTGDGLAIYSADELGFGNPDAGAWAAGEFSIFRGHQRCRFPECGFKSCLSRSQEIDE